MRFLLAHRRALGLLAGLALLAALLTLYEPSSVAAKLRTVNWSLALPAILGLTTIHVFQIESWRLLSLRLARVPLRRVGASMAYYAGQAFGTLTPANLGSDLYRAVRVKDAAAGWDGAVAPIVGQRLVSTLALLLLAGASALLTTLPHLPSPALTALCGGTAALVTAVAVSRQPPRRWYQRLAAATARRLPERVRDLGGTRPSAFGLPLVLASLFHVGSVLLVYLLVLAVHPGAPFFATVSLLLLTRLTILLPITPYGLGFQEASLALALPTVGLPAEAALAVSVLNRLAMLLTAGIGVTVLIASQTALAGRLPLTGPLAEQT